MRETGRYGVEMYLKKQVAAAGGMTRKFVSPGRPNVPDQIVIWKRILFRTPGSTRYEADIDFIETKSPGKGARAGQEREHDRLRKMGCRVYVLDTKARVDSYVEASR